MALTPAAQTTVPEGTTTPFDGFYQSFAGATWAGWLFVVGLAGIGVGLTLGIGMRIAAVSGAAMLVMMWSAALWPENNPFMDDHLIYAVVLIALAFSNAGDTGGPRYLVEEAPDGRPLPGPPITDGIRPSRRR